MCTQRIFSVNLDRCRCLCAGVTRCRLTLLLQVVCPTEHNTLNPQNLSKSSQNGGHQSCIIARPYCVSGARGESASAAQALGRRWPAVLGGRQASCTIISVHTTYSMITTGASELWWKCLAALNVVSGTVGLVTWP